MATVTQKNDELIKKQLQEIEKLKKELEDKKTKITNQTKQLSLKNAQINQFKQKGK